MSQQRQAAQHCNAKAAVLQTHSVDFTKLKKFTEAGLALVPILPEEDKPSKAPRSKGWNRPRSSENPDGYTAKLGELKKYGSGTNFGLHHGANNTLALDLDDLALARQVFEELTDGQLLEWLGNEHRAEVKSPKANRGKLLFTLPADFVGAGLKQFKHNGKTIFEIRCGNCQDVIIGEHPEGGNYQFIGDPSAIPEAPEILLNMLEHWDDWKHCFDSALGIAQSPQIVSSEQSQPAIEGWLNPIQEYNQSYSVTDVLIRNGYKQKGKDRFIRPGSESKAPGVALMRNCKDGIERIFSHGGDCLNDDYAHDAFDCYRLLECGGNFNKAIAWSDDITKHNQRLYMQEKDRIASEIPHGTSGQNAKWQPFPFIRADELTAKPTPIDWLLENIIERGSLNLLFGEPGAGKSLFASDWAFCMAAGIDWHGYRTKPVDVVVVAGEGHAGMARRLRALELKYKRQAPEQLIISQRPANLSDGANAQWVADTIKMMCSNPGLVIVDTLHRNMDGDENSSQDIGRFISNLDQYLKPLGCAILVVHHSGHADKTRGRGSSSIKAAMDAEFSVSKEGATSIMTCTKSKDFEASQDVRFGIKPVELDDWLDDDGEPLTSVYLEYIGEAKSTNKKQKLSARNEAILTSLSDATAAHGVEPPAEIKAKFGGFDSLVGKHKKIVNIDHWRQLAYKAIVLNANTEDAKRMAFMRCRNKLLEQRMTVEYDNYAWRIFE